MKNKQSSKIRVVYILKMYPRFSETFIVNEILAHEKAGLDIDIYSLRAPVDGRFHDSLSRVHANVKYIQQKCSSQQFWEEVHATLGLYPNLMTALEKLKSEKAQDIYQALLISQYLASTDVTHIHVHFANVAAVVAKIVSAITGLPYTMTTHAKDIYHQSVKENELAQKINNAKQVIAISRFNLNNLCSRFPDSTKKITQIYNGLDLGEFRYKAPVGRSSMILAVGRLVEKKGFLDLIDACAILKRSRVSFKCIIVGAGEMHNQIQDKIISLSLSGHVELMGPQPQWKVIELMYMANMMVAPCIVGIDGNRDGLPTVLLEAMALGTPCISTDVTAIPELISHQKSGIITLQNNPQMLAESLKSLLGNDELCLRLSKNARKKIEDNFDIHKNTTLLRRLFSGSTEKSIALIS